MNDILIIKNISHEGPGLLQEVLNNANISSRIVDLHKGESFPYPLDYKALIVLGGPDSANDRTPKMTQELEQIKIALDAGIPYLGICLGMQTLIKAAGGTVVQATQKEVGFVDLHKKQFTIELTTDSKTDPLLTNLNSPLTVFHLHGETVTLTDSMQLLGRGKYCKNQIIKVSDKAYGIQSHFELNEEMLREWAKKDPDLIPIGEEDLVTSYKVIQNQYNNIGRTIFTNFLRIAGLL